MSYGMVVHNTSGEILISSDMDNMHFAGKAVSQSNDGGAFTDFPGYSGTNDALDGRVVFTYSIQLSQAPTIFIKPYDYDRWHAIVSMENIGSGTWVIKVIASGSDATNAPELYCFIPAKFLPNHIDTHGMLVLNSNGDPAFDSRKQPLSIIAGGSFTPGACPINDGCPTVTSGHTWNYSSLDWDFGSGSMYTSTSSTSSRTNLMFSAPSLAQAVYKRQQDGYKCSSIPWYQGGGCQQHWSTAMWWGMYRSAFRLRDGYFDSGWAIYHAGYSFKSNYASGGWFGGGGGSYSSGTMPYTAKTINLRSDTFLIADSSRYDDSGIVVSGGSTGGGATTDTVLELGGYSHVGHTVNTGSISHLIGTINVPVGVSLNKVTILGKSSATLQNLKNSLDKIVLGGITVWTGSLGEFSEAEGGSAFVLASPLNLGSGNKALELFVSSASAEADDIIDIRNVKFYFS